MKCAGKSGHHQFGSTDRRSTRRNDGTILGNLATSKGNTDNTDNMGNPNNKDNPNPTTPGTHRNRKRRNDHGRKNDGRESPGNARHESDQNRPGESLRTGPRDESLRTD